MATVTIRAADSAQALEEVMRCLGPEALILSTRTYKGQVEIVAAPAHGLPTPGGTPSGPAAAGGFAAHFLQQIAAPIPACGVLPPQLPGRVLLVGPPGAGCSTLAARLAAETLRCPGAARPHLIAPRADLLAAPGRLATYAHLLGLVPHRPVWTLDRPFDLPAPATDETQIVDLSDMPQAEPLRLRPLRDRPDSALWLALPTGLHPALLDSICARFAGLASQVVLTRSDLFPPTSQDLETATRHGLPVALLSGGTGLLDALSPLAPGLPAESPTSTADPVQALSHEELPDASARLS